MTSDASTAATKLPAFTLNQPGGGARSFPSGRTALLAFVHEECETCNLSMPLIELAHRAFGQAIDVWAIGQDAEGNAKLVERYGLTLPMLDDSALHTSYAYDLDTVPALILAGGDGSERSRFIGFDRVDWQRLFAELSTLSGLAAPAVEWGAYPQSRPGCGSLSVLPGIAERLAAEAEGSPLRARRIEVAADDDEFEFMFDQGFTDGLPVVPPTPERVLRMLAGTSRDAQEVIATAPPNMAPVTVEKVAINAVMAGCKSQYLPVVLTAVEAICNDEFNAHGVWATTMGASPVMVVNGPVRDRIGMNSGMNALGQGNRANATIGRALRLIIRNIGGARPGGTERATIGWPGKFTLSFAEWEERSPWEPLHVERGFKPDDSVLTMLAMTGGPQLIIDQTSRSAYQLAGSFGMSLAAVQHPKQSTGDVLVLVCPEHADTLARDGWTKAQLRERILEVSARPLRERLRDGESGAGIPPARFGPDGPSEQQLDEMVPKFRSADNIHIVVTGGGAGKFSGVLSGWASGSTGSIPTSRKIEEA